MYMYVCMYLSLSIYLSLSLYIYIYIYIDVYIYTILYNILSYKITRHNRICYDRQWVNTLFIQVGRLPAQGEPLV